MAQDVTRKFEVWINDKTQRTIYKRVDVLKLWDTTRYRSVYRLRPNELLLALCFDAGKKKTH